MSFEHADATLTPGPPLLALHAGGEPVTGDGLHELPDRMIAGPRGHFHENPTGCHGTTERYLGFVRILVLDAPDHLLEDVLESDHRHRRE
jgi:hypothetical protein